MAGTQTGLLFFVLMASWINRTIMSPVAEQHIAAFDAIAKVNEEYGTTFLLFSSLVKCPLPFMLAFLQERGRVCIIHPSSALEGFDFSVLLSELPPFAQAVFDFPIISWSHLSIICYR